MKNILSTLLGLFILSGAFSQSADPKITEVTFTVSGVCDMCEARIEKAAMYTKGVKKADWDVQKQQITVIFRNDKTTQAAIEKAIAEVGYDTQNVKASDSAYNNLHGCCKYRGTAPH
jgi:mercuric ion binding protein